MTVVTVTLTLPVNGSEEQYIDALENARRAELAMGHYKAADALDTIRALAKFGLAELRIDRPYSG